MKTSKKSLKINVGDAVSILTEGLKTRESRQGIKNHKRRGPCDKRSISTSTQ